MPSLPALHAFLNDLLKLAADRDATTVCLIPGVPPSLRIADRLVKVSPTAFSAAHGRAGALGDGRAAAGALGQNT